MNQKRQSFFRRRIVAAAAAGLLIAAGIGGVALAQFTLSHRAKRVIAANGSDDQYFSSNMMQIQSTVKTEYINGETGIIDDVELTVCNYLQGNDRAWYDSDITYTLTARIVSLSGGVATAVSYAPVVEDGIQRAFTIAGNSLYSGNTVTFSNQTLSASAAQTNTYAFVIPVKFYNSDLYVELIADPDNPELKTITAYLNLQHHLGTYQSSWNVRLTDSVTDGTIGEYSGFNFQLYGSGDGSITLKWDPALLELSQVFWRALGSPTKTTANGMTGITFSTAALANSGTDIQFYRAGGAIATKAALEAAVTCTYPAPTPTPTPTPAP